MYLFSVCQVRLQQKIKLSPKNISKITHNLNRKNTKRRGNMKLPEVSSGQQLNSQPTPGWTNKVKPESKQNKQPNIS